MNYKISISNGKQDIDRYYEESFFNDYENVGRALNEMKETLDSDYPKDWDNVPKKKNVKGYGGGWVARHDPELLDEMRGDLEELERDNYLNK